jgi:hypothetical protein
MKKKIKSPEIARFITLLGNLKETPSTLAEKTGVSERTINNYIWCDMPIGGQLLRGLMANYAVSIDWLLSGRGEMFLEAKQAVFTDKALLPFFDTVDLNTLQDFWWLVARAVEESLRESGAVAGEDYNVVDLYQLAQPFVLAKFNSGELVLAARESKN